MRTYSKPSPLPEFILHNHVNFKIGAYNLDNIDECLNKEHYKNYPHEVEYIFNDRGFRDANWPSSNLNECIWCLGDSFTVGTGVPREHTWTYLLQEKTKKRTINVSMDGASNTWIARKTIQLIENIRPKNVILHWSYLHRREINDVTLLDEDRRQWYATEGRRLHEDDLFLTLDYIKSIIELSMKHNTTVIQSFIPNFSSVHNSSILYEKCKNELGINLIEYKVLDRARDGHHYDVKTSDLLTNNIVNSGLLSI